MPNLRAQHDKCPHPECEATRRLEQGGTFLVWGTGRHCELAAVAAAGARGLLPAEVVVARREYAAHLGLPTSEVTDSDDLIHLPDALIDYRPLKIYRINDLGVARVEFVRGRYSITSP